MGGFGAGGEQCLWGEADPGIPQAYEGVLQLVEARGRYEELCIVMCVVPATISNNVPGTDFSLGSDTAVNAAMEVCGAHSGAARAPGQIWLCLPLGPGPFHLGLPAL